MTNVTVLIQMSERFDGMDIAMHGKFVASSRNGASMKLARMLVDAGYPDAPFQTRRGRKVCMTGDSLHALAQLTVTEGAHSPRIVKWSPFVKEEAA